MTIEEFLNHCLRIKNHDTTKAIPCCANCKHYQPINFGVGFDTRWRCKHPRLMTNGWSDTKGWLTLQPEDFCSRWEERDGT